MKNYKFKTTKENKLRVNLKYPAHYTLLWTAYVNDIYNIYLAPKKKHQKYFTRIYWS